MSFALLEDDDEVFSAVLALLDESIEASEVPIISSLSPPNDDVCPSETLEGSHFVAARPVTYNSSKHRNGARELRRQEVHYLRTRVQELDTQLNALKQAAKERAKITQISTAYNYGEVSSVLVDVWKDLARRQLDQRLASERENSRLKNALADQETVRQMLQRALNTRVARRVGIEISGLNRASQGVIETSFVQERRSRRVHSVALETVDQELFEDLRVGVDLVYHEAAKVFFQVDAGDMTPPGVFGEKTLPFDLRTTAEAAWRCLAQSVHDEKCTFSFSSGNDWSELTHDKTVGESFGVEITVAENTADFRIKQVFRRYVESDRNVIAWRSYIDPATFRDQQIDGVRFQEKGSIVIRNLSELQPPGTEFTRLRIWHVITPEMRSSTTKGPAGQFVQELTNFVLGGSSSASTVQMIENMLMEQSRSRSASCTV